MRFQPLRWKGHTLVHKKGNQTERAPTSAHSFSNTLDPPPPVDQEPPRETPPQLPTFGSYCIRAQVDMYDGSDEVAHAVGWHTSPEIIQRTKDLCEIRKDKRRDQRCGDPIVTFTKYQKKCETPTVEFQRRPYPPS